MSWPAFVERKRLLSRARRHFEKGEIEPALALLADPRLALSDPARMLRQAVLETVARSATRALAQGDREGFERWKRVIAAEDPARAAALEPVVEPASAESSALVRLLAEMRGRPPVDAAHADARGAGSERARAEALRAHPGSLGLLAEAPGARADSRSAHPDAPGSPVDRRTTHPDAPGSPADRRTARPGAPGTPVDSRTTHPEAPGALADGRSANSPSPHSAPGTGRPLPAQRFHLAVDDGGEFLVACGTSLVIGHLRSTRADLPFLADVEAEHARVFRDESFHGGASWRIAAIGGALVAIGGRAIGPDGEAGTVLADGDLVQLASNLAFRFRTPEAASASALLELQGGAECEGARRVLLFAPGESGRVRIGGRRNRHVLVADLEHEVTLELGTGLLLVRCAGGVGPLESGRPSAQAQAFSVACPPARLVHMSAAARAPDRPPFSLSLRPSEPAPRAGRAV